MSLTVSQLRDRVGAGAGFSAVHQIDDSVVRSTRNSGKLPFAVYYFDVAPNLPATRETLTKYQDDVIGPYYFEGSKSLQWSNYLYFITSKERLASAEVRQAKDLIEHDRSYARKFVISEEELDAVLEPPTVAPSVGSPHANILSVWKELLSSAGLEKAILSDDDLPARLQLIEKSPATHTKKHQEPNPNVIEGKAEPFLESLHLKGFRSFPLQRNFTFGAANLIFGANGSGKTSLLEAIELFYCGRNKRNRDDSSAYELIGRLADGRTENATEHRKPQHFRDRNLIWYGQAEVKTNDIYRSFAQFNFLDTDAAASVAESTSRIEEDLSKLLVGPDASKVWHDIERVDEAVAARLRDLRPRERQLADEIAAINRRIKETSNVKQESDSIRVRLEQMMRQVGWTMSPKDNDVMASNLVESLTELESLSEQAASLDWVESPVSLDSLSEYSRAAKASSEKSAADLDRLEASRKNEKRLTDARNNCQEALNLAEEVARFLGAGVPSRFKELSQQQSAAATYSGWLAGLDTEVIDLLPSDGRASGLIEYHKNIVSNRRTAENSLAKTKSEHSSFTKLRSESLNLAQQLRDTAARILQTSPKPDECPLCHTHFGQDELAKHIKRDIDGQTEPVGRAILKRLREQERAVQNAIAAEAASTWLKEFSKRASLASDVTVRSALAEVEKATQNLKKARVRLQALGKELDLLEAQGLSRVRWEQLTARLHELGHPIAKIDSEAVAGLISVITRDLTNSSKAVETEQKQVSKLRQTLEAALDPVDASVRSLRTAIAEIKERLATTEMLHKKLVGFSSSFPWPGKRALAELLVEAAAIRKVAAEFQAAVGRENQAKTTLSESTIRKAELTAQRSRLRKRIERFADAENTFVTIRNQHSLAGAMESALKKNRTGIETIFSRIHSPADFRGLGNGLTTLVRKVGGEEAKLSQISTGQRAAFALSIFLAQNAQLRIAPPVLLIDDPIAHVDDLNSLSFLDYLREVVLTGKRQVFFATANDKLASLFERKFDFLGSEEFQRFNFRREVLRRNGG